MDKTNYSRSKTLAEFSLFGERFRIVRKRWDGKYWALYPKAVVCVWSGIDISGGLWQLMASGTPEQAAEFMKSRITKKFPGEQALKEKLKEIEESNNHARHAEHASG